MTLFRLLALTCIPCLTLAAPVAAQTVPANAQCDQVMIVGTQHFSDAVVAACTPYFTALANGAIAPGTFTTTPTTGGITLSTNGG